MPYTVRVTDLEDWLAAQARALGLDAANMEYADPEVLRDFCRAVLAELAARGLLAAPEAVGCYAVRREEAN